MADFRATIYSIDEGGGGSINWQPLMQVTSTVARLHCLPGDLLAALSDRLKSEATYVVLNTLTALHTICLNSKQAVHDQLLCSKCMKYLERLLNKPPFPGVEVAAAQLLMDWAFLYGQEELGHRSFAALTGTSKHRGMLQSMAASDVAIMLKEDQKLGLPQFSSVLKGLDFQKHFATQLAGPLTGSAAPPGVASQLAKAAVAASYSDDAAAAAAAAASRNTFAAWAERVQQDPQAAAQRVLNSSSHIQADMDALEAAQEACVAAAREYAKQQPPGASSSSSSSSSIAKPAAAAAAAGSAASTQLRHQLDKAYLAACKANEWREMTAVLVQQRLPDTQLSALLALADKVNAVLDGWQQAATTEIFWLVGVDTAGLADGSILPSVVAAATTAAGTGVTAIEDSSTTQDMSTASPAAAAAGGGGVGGVSRQQQQQPGLHLGRRGSLVRGSSSYLDLLTGDSIPATSSNNPFLVKHSSTHSSSSNAVLNTATPAAGASAGAAAAAAAGAPPDELQRYLQELGVTPTHSAASGEYSNPLPSPLQPPPLPPQQQQHYPGISQLPLQQSSSGKDPVQHQRQQQQQHYPAVRQGLQDGGLGSPQPAQQQQQHVPWVGQQVPLQQHIPGPQQQQQQQQQQQRYYPAVHSIDRTSSSSTSSSTWPRQHTPVSAAAAAGSAGPSSTGSAAAAAAIAASTAAAAASARAAAAGDTGSSSDSPAAVTSYTNPFASLDTRTVMKGLMKGSHSHNSSSSNAAADGMAHDRRTSTDSSELKSSASRQQQQQQQLGLMLPAQEPQGLVGVHAQQGSPLLVPLSPAPALQQQQHAAAAAAVSGMGAHAAHPQQQQQQRASGQLQLKVQQLFDGLNSNASSTRSHQSCVTCSLPSRPVLEAAVLQLLGQQQQQHDVLVQQLQQQHQQQVAEIKAMAVQRFKELQQQLAAHQQQ